MNNIEKNILDFFYTPKERLLISCQLTVSKVNIQLIFLCCEELRSSGDSWKLPPEKNRMVNVCERDLVSRYDATTRCRSFAEHRWHLG